MQKTIQQDKPITGVQVMIKPPRLFFISIGLGLMLQLLRPFPITSSFITVWLGLGLLSGSLGLMFWAGETFKRWQTAVNPDYAATTLVTNGPFRFSRNPMYLAFVLIQLGIGLVVNSGWLLLTLLPAGIILRWGIIAREERYLTELFGQEYVDYKTAVRRWL